MLPNLFRVWSNRYGPLILFSHLVFKYSFEALTVCDTTIVQLPAVEQATNLGNGIWLIQSAQDVTFREDSSSSVQGSFVRGCRICFVDGMWIANHD